jgi:hypothetical protein
MASWTAFHTFGWTIPEASWTLNEGLAIGNKLLHTGLAPVGLAVQIPITQDEALEARDERPADAKACRGDLILTMRLNGGDH